MIIFFDRLQQRCCKTYREIREELIRLGSKAGAHDEADQRTVQCAHEKDDVGIEVGSFAKNLEILKATAEKHQINDKDRNSTFDANLEVGHVHAVPDERIGFEVANTDPKDRIMLDAIEGAHHKILAIFVGSVGRLVGGAVAGKGGKAVIELSAGGGHYHDADEASRHDQVKAFSLNGEVVEGDTPANNQIDETGPGCGHKNGDRHHQHSEKPKDFDGSILRGDHEGQRKRQR